MAVVPQAGDGARPAYVDELAAFACGTRLEDMPPAVVDRCRRVIADNIAVIAAGMQSAEMQRLADLFLDGCAQGEAWVPGARRRAPAREAGFLNGTAGTWHDYDEGNTAGKGHPGMQVTPGALAYAQQAGASGRELLVAIAVGYEICARIGAASAMRFEVHPHGTTGTVGAAAAIARLKGCSAGAMREVLNVAATMAMATNRQAMLDEATVRNVYTGHSALAGHIATQLVAAGVTGQRDGIGFTYGGVIADGFDPAKAVDGLGRRWLLADGYFKLHPAGRYAHAAIDALFDAASRAPGGRIPFGEVESIEVRAFRLAAMLSGRRVTTSFGAKFSIPFALATILYHGRSALDCYDERAVANAEIAALAARVAVAEDPAYTADYPKHHRCTVRVRLRGGQVFEGRCERMRGDPGNPHRPEEVEAKFFALTVPLWGEALAREIYGDCMRLEALPDARAWARRHLL
jgi:2-methylcitrate dehydratase PrpD